MANIKQIKVGSSTYDVEALHFVVGALDTPAQWKNYIDNLVGEGLQIVTDTPNAAKTAPATAASADTMGKLYLVTLGTEESGTYTEFVTLKDESSGTASYSWEKIGTTATDLSEYAKAGTYSTSTSTIQNTGSAGGETITTSSAGAQTSTGSCTVTYYKADASTGSAGAATVNGSNFTFTGTAATPTIKIDKHTIAAHTHTVNAATASIGSASGWSAGSVPTRASFTYATGAFASTATVVPSYTTTSASVSKAGAIGSVSLSASTVSTDGPTYLQDATFTAASLGAASTGTVSISGGAASLTTKNYGFSTAANTVMYNPTVSADGILSWSTANAATQNVLSYTAPGLAGTTMFVTGYPSFSGGSLSKTTRYMKVTSTAVDGVNVIDSISPSGLVTVPTALTTASAYQITGVGTAPALTITSKTVMTGATLSSAGGITLSHTQSSTVTTGYDKLNNNTYTPAGTIGGSQTIAAHTHSVGSSTATASGTGSFAVSAHTHTVTTTNHTHSMGHTHTVTVSN